MISVTTILHKCLRKYLVITRLINVGMAQVQKIGSGERIYICVYIYILYMWVDVNAKIRTRCLLRCNLFRVLFMLQMTTQPAALPDLTSPDKAITAQVSPRPTKVRRHVIVQCHVCGPWRFIIVATCTRILSYCQRRRSRLQFHFQCFCY
jgi:hypothetical protein